MAEDTSAPKLTIRRTFPVPPETVFDTLTDPKLMPIWWGNDATIEVDLRVDGTWTVVRTADGTEYLATGTFLEVERPHRLVYTFGMPQFSPNQDTISVALEVTALGSAMVYEHSGSDIAAELNGLEPGQESATEAGWQHGFDLMKAAWEELGG